jgi:hypothetical protein
MSAPATAVAREAVFVARDLAKFYQVGDVRVDALRGVSFEILAG